MIKQIVKEFETHAGPIWTRKLNEALALKNLEVIKANDNAKAQIKKYLVIEEQRDSIAKTLHEQSREYEGKINLLKVKIEGLTKK